jgi:hypothetical protein
MQTQADVAHIVDSALLTQGAALDNDARLLTHVAILEAIRRWSSGALGLDAVGSARPPRRPAARDCIGGGRWG